MTLIKCKECGKKISDKAKECPSCGDPKTPYDGDQEKSYTLTSVKKNKAKKFVKNALLSIGIFFIPIVFSWFTLRKGYPLWAKVLSILWLSVFSYNMVSSSLYENKNEIVGMEDNKGSDEGLNGEVSSSRTRNEGGYISELNNEKYHPSSKIIDPEKIIFGWESVGMRVDIPWSKSRGGDKNYDYLAQARGYVGGEGELGFRTEVEGEVFGFEGLHPHHFSIELEVWNTESETEGVKMAVRAMRASGVDVPEEVINAFENDVNIAHGKWRVTTSHREIKIITATYKTTRSP